MSKNKNGGFTIIESLLFLSASAALVVLAVNVVGGRNEVVQFQDSMRGLEQRIDLTYSYAVNGTVLDDPNCTYNGAYDFSSSNNFSCTVLGYVMEFPDYESASEPRGSDARNDIDIFPVFALRSTSSDLATCSDFQLECVKPIAHTDTFDTYSLEWGSEVFAAITISSPGSCGSPLPICQVNAFGFVKLPETGAITPIAYLGDVDYKKSSGEPENNLHNVNIPSIINGGSRRSLIGNEVRFIACVENAQNDKFGSYYYNFSYQDVNSGDVAFAGSDDYVSSCDLIRGIP